MIDDQHATWPHQAGRLLEHAAHVVAMMQRAVDGDDIRDGGFQGHAVRIGEQGHVTHTRGPLEAAGRDIHADRFPGLAAQRGKHIAGAASDIHQDLAVQRPHGRMPAFAQFRIPVHP